MYAVIFEVYPRAGHYETYLDIAAKLRPELDKIDGFISIERFTSIVNEGKVLSLSFWESEEAIIAWRNHVEHQLAQKQGRNGIFADYRLRVACVARDYGMFEREQAPQHMPDAQCANEQLTVDCVHSYQAVDRLRGRHQ